MNKLILVLLIAVQLFATNYYVSTSGSDSNNGLTISTPWLTLYKVNDFSFSAGDSVLFKRGDTWILQQLLPQNGNSSNNIVYSDYGTGDKPLFLGSLNKSETSDWTDMGSNVWQLAETIDSYIDDLIVGGTIIDEPLQFTTSASVTWSTSTLEYHTPPSSQLMNCTSSGSSSTDVKLSLRGFNIEDGKCYKLSFWAKSTKDFSFGYIKLMKNSADYDTYSGQKTEHSLAITSTWKEYSYYFKSDTTASDANLTIYLGNTIPDLCEFYIDDFVFQECSAAIFNLDVGNIIFNSEAIIGVKKWALGDLSGQNHYFLDEDTRKLYIYSVGNPATFYSDIELALTRNMISLDKVEYVEFNNLELKYGSAHGISGGNNQHITIDNCDISYIGGGNQAYLDPPAVRYGNGVQFWGNSANNLVKNCTVYEIYDAGLTNQYNSSLSCVQSNITYERNVIYNCEYSFEFWVIPPTSTMEEINFINNTCLFAGSGWGHDQRWARTAPDPSGRHVSTSTRILNEGEVNITNNIFYHAEEYCFRMRHTLDWSSSSNLTLDYNCYYQPSGNLINFDDDLYTQAQFATYQSAKGKDANSFISDVNMTTSDYTIDINSPCLDTGNPSTQKDNDSTRADVGAIPFLYQKVMLIGNQSGSINDTLIIPVLINFLNEDNNVKVYSFELEHDENIEIIAYDLTGAVTNTSFRMNFYWTQADKYSFGSYGINKLLTSVQDTLMSIKAVLLESGTCDLNLTTKFNNSALSISNNAGTITISE